MQKQITADNLSYFIYVPDKCPICHHYGDTQIISTFSNSSHQRVEILFQCVYPNCHSLFIGYYPNRSKGNKENVFYLTPQKPEVTIFKASVKDISPQFLAIYQQAEEARALGLEQIAGPGYRKAFEFLIKDYAKSLAPDRKEDIEKTFAGNVVNEYILDTRIQAVAKRALWLGNDETHYLRKWESHDIEDLIVLIKLTTDWIDIEQLSKKYFKEMPEEE